ncbi:MAG: hypothetical protein ACYTFQ_27720 [Planctomycetota bacterium]
MKRAIYSPDPVIEFTARWAIFALICCGVSAVVAITGGIIFGIIFLCSIGG